MVETIVDYSEHFPIAIAAHGRGRNVLILSRLPKPTCARFDGKPASYELDYRWLSRDCTRPEDGAFRCVQGSETTYWQRKELGPAFAQALKAGTLNLFDHFQVFS
jgi:hypothetical protein